MLLSIKRSTDGGKVLFLPCVSVISRKHEGKTEEDMALLCRWFQIYDRRAAAVAAHSGEGAHSLWCPEALFLSQYPRERI